MRRREFFMVIAMLTIALVSAKANPAVSRNAATDEPEEPAAGVETNAEAEVSPTEMLWDEPSPLISKDKALGAAYFNTLSILSTSNECSLFFGGPAASVEVFKRLMSKVQKAYFTTPIGIRMSGETVNVNNVMTKTEYRLFDKVSINADGPFYRRKFSRSNVPLHSIGTFEPNTEEVRVLMFLHELGHVMKGEDGHWLLPNDGKDESMSRLNSQKIEKVCGEQIKSLRNREAKDNAQLTLASKTDHAAVTKREAAPIPEQ